MMERFRARVPQGGSEKWKFTYSTSAKGFGCRDLCSRVYSRVGGHVGYESARSTFGFKVEVSICLSMAR